MRSWNEICRAITAFSNPWTSEAFQVIVAIAVLIVPICCFEGVAYSLEFSASNPSFREAGIQDAVYQAMVDDWGSPLRRFGAYDNAPFVMESEIVDAVWDLGAAATVYRNLGVRQEMKPIPAREMPNLPDSGTTVLYHGGRLDNGTVQSRRFSTTTDYLYAREYARLRGGQVFQYNVPNSFINENALRRIDNIVESPFAGEEYRFVGPNVRELNRFLQK